MHSISAVYKVNSNSLKIDPCGTPKNIVWSNVVLPAKTTDYDLSDKYNVIHASAVPTIPNDLDSLFLRFCGPPYRKQLRDPITK